MIRNVKGKTEISLHLQDRSIFLNPPNLIPTLSNDTGIPFCGFEWQNTLFIALSSEIAREFSCPPSLFFTQEKIKND